MCLKPPTAWPFVRSWRCARPAWWGCSRSCAWPGLLANLRRQTAAQCATAVARGLAEPIATDAALFTLLHDAYDHLDAAIPAGPPEALLARFVLEALDVTGHAPCFDRCARCDTPAPDTAAVTVEPAAGGVVCRGCGGGRYRLAATDRADLRALLAGDSETGVCIMQTTTPRRNNSVGCSAPCPSIRMTFGAAWPADSRMPANTSPA